MIGQKRACVGNQGEVSKLLTDFVSWMAGIEDQIISNVRMLPTCFGIGKSQVPDLGRIVII